MRKNEYSLALFELAKDQIEKESFLNLFSLSLELFTPDVLSFFRSSFNEKEKREIINKSFKNNTFKNFINVLFDNNRLNDLEEISESYREIYLESIGKVNLKIVSSTPLSKEYINKLCLILNQRYNKEMIPNLIIDKDLKGGIKMYINNDEIDYSVDSLLDSLVNHVKEV